MRRLEQTNSSSITHLFIYALAFLLLWEWLRPIPTITDTSYIEVFVFFAFFSCVLIFLRVSPYLMIPSLLLGSIYGLHYIFHEGSFFSREGGMETIRFFLSDGWYNIKLIFFLGVIHVNRFFQDFPSVYASPVNLLFIVLLDFSYEKNLFLPVGNSNIYYRA